MLTTLALLCTCCPALPAADFSLHCSQPATLSLALDQGAWRLSYLGDIEADLTITGLIPAGAVAYRLDQDRRPAEQVPMKAEGHAVTLRVAPSGVYLLGDKRRVLQPVLQASLDTDEALQPGVPLHISARVTNNYFVPLEGRLALRAPEDFTVKPRRLQRFRAKPRQVLEVAFELSKQKLTLEDILRGDRKVRVALHDQQGNRAEQELTISVEDNPLTALGLVVEAEKLAAQGPEGVSVMLRDDKVNTSGGAFSNWNDKGQWLQWEFDVPRPGQYQLVFRFCNGSQDAARDFQLDGTYPDEACKKIVFPNTGGWSNDANDWRHYLLKDAQGQPVLINLTAGSHTIRMTNLYGDGGCNLDYILLLPEKR